MFKEFVFLNNLKYKYINFFRISKISIDKLLQFSQILKHTMDKYSLIYQINLKYIKNYFDIRIMVYIFWFIL